MTPIEKEDASVRLDLPAIGKEVDKRLPIGWGFVVLAFPTGAGGRLNYISNCERADVVRLMYEFVESTKETWGDHVPELSAAAEDEQIARLKQRVAELEYELYENKRNKE